MPGLRIIRELVMVLIIADRGVIPGNDFSINFCIDSNVLTSQLSHILSTATSVVGADTNSTGYQPNNIGANNSRTRSRE